MKHDWYPASGGGLLATLWMANPMTIALMKPTYVPNPDTHKVWADVAAQELASAGGYVQQTLAGKAQNYDAAQDRTNLIANDVVWDAVTFSTAFAVVFDNSGAKPLWSLVDFEGTKDVAAGVFTVDWAAVGTLYITKA